MRILVGFIPSLLAVVFQVEAYAQHHEHPVTPTPRLFQSDMAEMAGMTPDPLMDMQPGRWNAMTMGIVRILYNHQGGDSGDEAVESSNWIMGMLHRSFGQSRLTFMIMSSLEPATIHARGSPELFQTGESYQGRPLVDRQHPHDFFSNLSATYRMELGSEKAVWAQVAPVGEPALGPTAYMHRASTGDNPSSPLGHHWLDSSHITSNVVTLGGGWRHVTVEGSSFHGREPDEDRWDVDGGVLDSFSGRLKLSTTGPWSGQVSYGYLHEPEALEPGDTHRTTASLHYGARGDGPWAFTILWGQNREEHGTSNAYLAESAWQVTTRDQVFVRAEAVEKNEALLATKELSEEDHDDDLAVIYALTGGYTRNVPLVRQVTTGLGGDLTIYGFPSELEPVYGDFPLSFHVFLRVRWGEEHGHGGMSH